MNRVRSFLLLLVDELVVAVSEDFGGWVIQARLPR